MKKENIVIIGAGITGLTLGWKLSDNYHVIIVEKEESIGGICSSFTHNGFKLDYGPHKLYPQTEEVLNEIKSLYTPDVENLLEIKKRSSLALKGKLFNYPLEIKQIVTSFNPVLGANLVFSYGLSAIGNLSSKKEKLSYEDFVISKFGKGLYNLVFKENSEKIWGDPKTLSADLAKTRISSPNLITVLLNTLTKKKDPKVNAESFYYPKNSIKDLSERIAKKIKENGGKILNSSKIMKINKKGNRVEEVYIKSDKGIERIETKFLISTSHIRDSAELLGVPENVQSHVDSLKFRGLALVYIYLNKSTALKDNWIFFPEKRFVFQRISEQKSFSSFKEPQDKTVLVAEISIRPEIAAMKDEELSKVVIHDLEKAGLINASEVYGSFVLRKEEVYPIYTLDYKEHLNAVLNWTDNNFENFVTCGRNGLFNYNNMDHCMDMAIKISEHLKRGGAIERIRELRKYFESYKIVD